MQAKSIKTTVLDSGGMSTQGVAEGDSESDDSVGPMLPGQEDRSKRKRPGPSIPNMQDLELKRGIICQEADLFVSNVLHRNGCRGQNGATRRYSI